ncbi:MAG: protein kinase [Planctomycetota bacterium]
MDPHADAIRYRAVDLGILAEPEAGQLLAAFQATGEESFSDWLFAAGKITLDQMGQLFVDEDPNEATLAPAATDSGDPVVGQVFSGCRVTRKLGQGGMGSVYLADKLDTKETVVVKFLAPEQAQNPTWRGRFLREAHVLQRIAHPNIVGIHSVEGDSDQPHIVMEFVDGEPLDAALEQREMFPAMEAARISRDIAEALGHAHAAGVIHRDIKPANVLLGFDGRVKVLDFGLAKNVEVDDGLSLPGQILGTPHYMAPEQWGDHMVDARCDVFSLGATLYHLATGSVPFPGKNPQSISRKVLAGEMIPPSHLAPDMPEDLELVIFRMLAVNRNYRYPTAKQAAEDLDRVLNGEEIDVPRLVETTEKGTRRIPLLPGEAWVIGREEGSNIVVPDRSVSRQHARLERGMTGFVLQDLGSTYGTFVGGMRIRNVVLKSGDQVKFGKIQMEFKDGGLASTLTTRRHAPGGLQIRALPRPFVQILVEEADRRVVVALLEDLPEEAWDLRLKESNEKVTALLGPELAQDLANKVGKKVRRQRLRVPQYLFTITHENLADDVSAWLHWWDQARANYPAQLAPLHPRSSPRLRIRAGEECEPRTIPLSPEARVLTVGRDDDSKVKLISRSVSRLHSTLVRFHTRWAIRDEGSRFGTLLNGNQVRISFLRPGDVLSLGKVEAVFEVEDPDGSSTATDLSGEHELEPETFFTLVEKGHPSTANALISFLYAARDLTWIGAEAEGLFPREPEQKDRFAEKVGKQYTRWAEKAAAKLPEILGANHGEDPDAWWSAFEAKHRGLPPQVFPQGWFPPTTDSGSFKL